jgi:nucleotide-binding universal stress UspA family protein
MKKVLIVLDYDPTAQKVAEQGYALARTMKAEIILLHVVLDPLHYTSTQHVTIMGFAGHAEKATSVPENAKEMKRTSQHFLDYSKLHLGDNSIQTLVKEGDIGESILTTSKDLHVDVIVMGSHSRKGNKVLGSVTEKVLLNTAIPLFIIPTRNPN